MLYLSISDRECFLFPGFVPANREIWVLGDSFLTMAAQHLEYWKAAAQRDPHETTYMLKWYDVKTISSQSASSNAVEVITTLLVTMLNTQPKLPHTIVVLLGDTKFWCDDIALKYAMDTIMIGLLKEIKRIIQLRQRDLPPKAVSPDPLIYFVKLHWKPENAIDSVWMYPKKRRTFNRLLDSIMRPRGVKTISLNEITVKVDKGFFLNHRSLSERGFRQIWKSLSEAISDFDNFGHQNLVDFDVKSQNQVANVLSSNDSDIGDTNVEEDYHHYNGSWKRKNTKFHKTKGRGRRYYNHKNPFN